MEVGPRWYRRKNIHETKLPLNEKNEICAETGDVVTVGLSALQKKNITDSAIRIVI
jgi:hypothetical protein